MTYIANQFNREPEILTYIFKSGEYRFQFETPALKDVVENNRAAFEQSVAAIADIPLFDAPNATLAVSQGPQDTIEVKGLDANGYIFLIPMQEGITANDVVFLSSPLPLGFLEGIREPSYPQIPKEP